MESQQMLTLTRKEGQRVYLVVPEVGHLVVEVKDIRSGAIRIGFEAPRNVDIYREELYEKMVAEGSLVRPSPAEVAKALLRKF